LFLAKLGTFPHWTAGTLEGGGDGAPAWSKHLDAAGHGTPAAAELMKMQHSFPVHPTQIYESIVGLVLLTLLLWQRKHQKFRGQIFFLFAFAYGYLRFLIEMLRDDSERGEFGTFPLHLFVPGALVVMALAFVFGISLGITNVRARMIARVAAFVPPVVAYLMLAPAKFGEVVQAHPSTSQWIGLLSALGCAYFYARFWEIARKSPKAAMSLESLGDIKPMAEEGRPRRRDDDEDEDEGTADGDATADAEVEELPKPRKKKGKKKGLRAPAATAEGAADDDSKEEPDAKEEASESAKDDADAKEEASESAKADSDEEPAKDTKARDDKPKAKEPAESA
jgi:phosphatidylglycerol:prolipoprotein diacylglycerol transferase